MKNLKLMPWLMAAVSLLLASCSIDNLSSVEIDDGEECLVSLSVQIPGDMSTRNAENEVDPIEPDPDAPKPEPEPEPEPERVLDTAVPGAATKINSLSYFVYKEIEEIYETGGGPGWTDTRIVYVPTETYGTVSMTGLTTTLDIPLVKGIPYRIVFWADAYGFNEKSPYSFDKQTGKISIDFDKIESNKEQYDAFFGSVDIENPSGGRIYSATLKRPFAQINMGVNMDEVVALGVSRDRILTGIEVECANAINIVKDGWYRAEYEDIDVRTFKLASIPSNYPEFKFPVEPEKYDYICLNYVVPYDHYDAIPLKFNYVVDGVEQSRTINIPLQINYRTNIYGDLLTAANRVKVTIDPFFSEEYGGDHNVDYEPVLTPLHETAKYGGRFVLEEDWEVYETIVVEDDLVVDLNNHTILKTADKPGQNVLFVVENGASLTFEGMGYVKAVGASAGNNIAVRLKGPGVTPLLYIWGGNFDGDIIGTNAIDEIDDTGAVTITGGAFKNYNYHGYDRVSTSLTPGLKIVKIGDWDCVVDEEIPGDSAYMSWVDSASKLQSSFVSSQYTGRRYIHSNKGVTYMTYDNTTTVYASEWGTAVDLGGLRSFEFDGNATQVVIQEGIKYIEEHAFAGIPITKVTLPCTIKRIEEEAFAYTHIKEFIAPDSLQYMGKKAFYGSRLDSVNFDKALDLHRINEGVFASTSIRSIEFPEFITYFGAECLASCYNLREVTFKAESFEIENASMLSRPEDWDEPMDPIIVNVCWDMWNYTNNMFSGLSHVELPPVAPPMVEPIE